MVKHTQTIRRQKPMNFWSVLDHFVRLALKGLKIICVEANIYYFMYTEFIWQTKVCSNSSIKSNRVVQSKQ